MAYSALQKLLRNQAQSQSQSAAKIIARLREPYPPLPQFALTRIPQIANSTDRQNTATDNSKPNPPFVSPRVYPSFSFGLFLNPVSAPNLVWPEAEVETTSGGLSEIRADSVKKKRKKKMNKHKLRKLRKRLMRKT